MRKVLKVFIYIVLPIALVLVFFPKQAEKSDRGPIDIPGEPIYTETYKCFGITRVREPSGVCYDCESALTCYGVRYSRQCSLRYVDTPSQNQVVCRTPDRSMLSEWIEIGWKNIFRRNVRGRIDTTN